ncbi:MAG: DnaJ domain-containing protein [Planctomycetes bacterium]|nr:DnaJ domain-containing protein [Planctomycetota bacterium]
MDPTPYSFVKIAVAGRLVLAVCGIAVGFLLSKTGLAAFGMVLATLSFFHAAGSVARLGRVFTAERDWRTTVGDRLAGAARSSELPRQIFLLLFTVAEADGRAGQLERNIVQQFVLERFPDPLLALQLARWDARPLGTDELGTLARGLRARLSRTECETLFYWCCLVALVDQRFRQSEHDVLQVIARQLGIDPAYARVMFLNAKERVLRARAWREAAGADGQRDVRPTDESPAVRRRRALATLGLDESATPDEIRRRHRALAKKHHPDAHSHLGPVAQQEATERFRAIQAAYEELRP